MDAPAAGHLSYQLTDALVVATRTAVEPGFADGAVADALVRTVFDDVRSEGSAHVVPVCPDVTWWVSRNPDAAALVYAA